MKKLIISFQMILLCFCVNVHAQDDPLRNTKKLAKQGHLSLYKNGALKVPNTQITLIPPGPSSLDMVLELAGFRAKQSLLLSLRNARDAVYLVADGTRASFRVAADVKSGGDEIAKNIRANMREKSKLLVYRAPANASHIIGESFQFSKDFSLELAQASDRFAVDAIDYGAAIRRNGLRSGIRLTQASIALSGEMMHNAWTNSADSFSFAGRSFVRGYVALPAKTKQNFHRLDDELSLQNFTMAFSKANKHREQYSNPTVELMGSAIVDMPSDVGRSLSNAADELSKVNEQGISFSSLKAIRWLVQALLYDAVVKPIGKFSSGLLGYVTVNGIVFPVMVVANEGVELTELAVEVIGGSATTGYDLIAPSATAALASVYGAVQFLGLNSAAVVTAGGGTTVGMAEAGVSQVLGVSVSAGGYVSGKSVKYIGVPLAAAGITLGGTASGVVSGSSQVVGGSTLLVTSETAALGTQVAGNIIAGVSAAAGTLGSVAVGGGLAVFELSKSVIVPVTYELGSGVVLGYSSLSQLSAHSILAAADMAYMVLSLEGPRWVLYAVKGDLNDGTNLMSGTVLDLEQMQNAGEAFYAIEISDTEMKNLVEHVHNDMPEAPDTFDPFKHFDEESDF